MHDKMWNMQKNNLINMPKIIRYCKNYIMHEQIFYYGKIKYGA